MSSYVKLFFEGFKMTIKRVCGAIIRNDKILMVLHKHDKREYWTLPGGEVEIGESPEDAVIREILEETHIKVEVQKQIFDEKFENSICRCYLMSETNFQQSASLGFDPEESHLPQEEKMLQDLKWQSLEEFKNDKQVNLVLAHFKN